MPGTVIFISNFTYIFIKPGTMIFILQIYIVDWNARGQPMIFILYFTEIHEQIFTVNGLSDTALFV